MTAAGELETVGKLIKSFGPTDEQRKAFSQTFLGTLLGQSILLVGMVVTYVGVLVALNKYAINDLNALRLTFGNLFFWLAVAAPLICILLFSMVPTLWRAFRERSLKAKIIEGDQQFKAGYFRLYAYGEADSEAFKRLDELTTRS